MKKKSRILKPLTAIIGLLSIIISILIIQGCVKNDETTNDMPYLKLSSQLENMNSQDKEVLKQSKERLAKYISSDNGIFSLKIKSGSEVNISDEIFEYFQSSINKANLQLKDKSYAIDGDRVVKKIKLKAPRLKSGVAEESNGQYYVSQTGVDYTWYGMNINISHEDIQAMIKGTATVAIILSKCKTGNPAFDAWIEAVEVVAALAAVFADAPDRGYGYTIGCVLYVPTFTVSY